MHLHSIALENSRAERQRSDRPKVPRGLREQSQNEHRTTTKPIWQACRDLAKRPCYWGSGRKTSYQHLVRWNCVEICCRDLAKRSLTEISSRDFANRPPYRELLHWSLQEILPRDIVLEILCRELVQGTDILLRDLYREFERRSYCTLGSLTEMFFGNLL